MCSVQTLDVTTMERLLAHASAQVFEKKAQEWDQVRVTNICILCAMMPRDCCAPYTSSLQVRERLGMAMRSLAALQVLQELVTQNQAVVATAFEFCITAAALEAPRLDR